MPDVHDGPCFLCSRPSSYQIIDGGQRRCFRCGTCKSFIISDRAEKLLAAASELKKQLSQQSYSLPDDKILHMFASGLPSGVGDGQEKLEVEIELKSMWLRRST